MTHKYKLHPFFDDSHVLTRSCDQEGCVLPGEFKAPRSRSHLRDYFWFCLDHVRDYNEHWNYYTGMDAQELEHEQRLDVTWQRPTWPFARTTTKSFFFHHQEDPLNIFNGATEDKNSAYDEHPRFSLQTEEGKALGVMNLSYPFTRKELKLRYIGLAKKYHPDMNGGSREAEERLKEINRAYETLKKLVEF